MAITVEAKWKALRRYVRGIRGEYRGTSVEYRDPFGYGRSDAGDDIWREMNRLSRRRPTRRAK